MNDFDWKSAEEKLGKIPDSYRFTQKDFDAGSKLIEKLILSPEPPLPRGTRVTKPANYEFETLFMEMILVAQRLKGDSKRFPTMKEVRAYQRQQAERHQ